MMQYPSLYFANLKMYLLLQLFESSDSCFENSELKYLEDSHITPFHSPHYLLELAEETYTES